MPGLLKRSARCPKCKRDLCATSRTTNAAGTTYEFIHSAKYSRRCLLYQPAPMDRAFDQTTYANLHRRTA